MAKRVHVDSQPLVLGQAGPTALTDSTGGTVSATLAAGITDTVAKNAIASLNAQINALQAVLKSAGLIS